MLTLMLTQTLSVSFMEKTPFHFRLPSNIVCVSATISLLVYFCAIHVMGFLYFPFVERLQKLAEREGIDTVSGPTFDEVRFCFKFLCYPNVRIQLIRRSLLHL